jgi:predicted dehydrogenase
VSSSPEAVIRLGLIGAGRWGKNFIRTIRGLNGVTLSALCSRHPDSRSLVDFPCKILRDWHDLVGNDLCDGVIIATPPDTHAEILGAMIRARIPSMVEKPLTLDLQEALDLQQLLRQNPTPVLVDHTYLFHPAYRELKRLSSQLGPIRSIQSEGGGPGPFRPSYTALWDYGPHDISMCLDLLGKTPQSVTCKAFEANEGGKYECDLLFPGNVRASIKVGNLASTKVRILTVRHDEHALTFDDLSPQKLRLDNTPITVVEKLPLQTAVETLVSGIRSGTTEPFELAVEVIRTLHVAQQSLRGQQTAC